MNNSFNERIFSSYEMEGTLTLVEGEPLDVECPLCSYESYKLTS